MKIEDHRLLQHDDGPVDFVKNPNSNANVRHEYLIIHYTAGTSAEAAISWLTNRNSRVSAHLVVARDGTITQLVSFDRRAWHAGASSWDKRKNLNCCSIGIELDNFGWLERNPEGKWQRGAHIYDDSEVIEAMHKFEFRPKGWHKFPDVQIEAALEIANLLVNHYGLIDVLGHDDISEDGKVDPGPGFPMQMFHARIYGLMEDEPIRFAYRTTRAVNKVLSGASTEDDEVEGSPLPRNIPVGIDEEQGDWALVRALKEVKGVPEIIGWVEKERLEEIRRHYHPPSA